MPLSLDMARMSSTTTGTGSTITLNSTVTGFVSFETELQRLVNDGVIATTNELVYAAIEDGANREVGIYLYTTGAPPTLTRVTILQSTNGGAAINLSGSAQIFSSPLREALWQFSPNDNLIINGGMEVSQERGSLLQSNAINYALDGWQTTFGGTMVVSAQQVTDAPPGFANSLKVSVTTAQASLGSGDYQCIFAPIEGYRTASLDFGLASAQSTAIGLWVKANRTGTYAISIINSAGSRSYPSSFTVNASGTWEYKTFVIPGDTTGTWLTTNGVGLSLFITMAAGSAIAGTNNTWQAGFIPGVTGQANGVAATSDYMQITGVSLVPGEFVVPKERSPAMVLSFDQALLLCQRYYEKSFLYATAPSTNAGGDTGESTFMAGKAGATAQSGYVRFGVRKRFATSVTFYNPEAANAQVRDQTAAVDCSATAASRAGEMGCGFTATGNSSTAVGNRLTVHWVADARL